MNKKQLTVVWMMAILLSLIFSFSTAFAAKGEVVYKKLGCSYFIVETLLGYAILEWYGGNDPDKGDIITGNFESYGFKNIYNLTVDAELRVYVDNYWLSRDRALERYFDKCH